MRIYASRKVIEPLVKKVACGVQRQSMLEPSNVLHTLRAHETLSKRAPVRQKRLNQTLKWSSHAVMRFASSGTRSSRSSSSVRVQTSAATSPPADVPDITRGSRLASRNALTTPKWSGVG